MDELVYGAVLRIVMVVELAVNVLSMLAIWFSQQMSSKRLNEIIHEL